MRYRFPSASMECPKYAWKVFNFLVLWRPFSVISDYNVTFTHTVCAQFSHQKLSLLLALDFLVLELAFCLFCIYFYK